MAQAAEQMRRFAIASDVGGRACLQCGGALSAEGIVSQAREVTCTRCGTKVVIEPGDAWRIFAASGARLLADAAALSSYEAMVRADLAISQYRDRKQVPLALLTEYEASARQHWTTVFEVEAQYVPEQWQYVASKIERHMHDVNRRLRDFWQWRQRAV
jgi:hypothetical protein